MQKKIIALALAGLVSGAAFAQSNVTVYGFVDQAYVYGKGDNAAGQSRTFSGIQDGGQNTSRVGFKGEEALGNGLKGIFTLEYGSGADENQIFNTVRQSFVGVSGGFGTVALGRQYAPAGTILGGNASEALVGINAMNQLQEALASANLGGTIKSASPESRWNNSIKFMSQNYSGFSGQAIYSFGETNKGNAPADLAYADTTDNSKLGLSASYKNGPFNIDVIYQAQYDVVTYAATGLATAKAYDKDEWYIGGGYDFGVARISGSYQQFRTDNKANVKLNSDADLWQIGVRAPVSKVGAVYAQYAEVNYDPNGASFKGNDGKQKAISIGYDHDLSKRTRLYTAVAYMDNDGNIPATGAWGNAGGVAAAGETNTTFMAGVRHAF